MRKTLLPALFCLSLCLSLLPAASASPVTAFTDVPAGSWFEQGVQTCARQGVMIGTSADTFSPNAQLSIAQCLTLALRLYDLRQGGTGELEEAPGDWGEIAMTFADGTVVKGEQNEPFFYTDSQKTGRSFGFRLAPEQLAWAKTVDAQTATVTLGGKSVTGLAQNNVGSITFHPKDDPEFDAIGAFYQIASHPREGIWYRDAVYSAEKWGLFDQRTHPGFYELVWELCANEAALSDACRYQFAAALYEAAGELPALYQVTELPDLKRDSTYTATEAVFALYEAGILTGANEYGTFDYFEKLTRAQAATMVARVLDEGQRVTTPPKTGSAYDQAVIDLRTGFTYYEASERTYETEDCTVFVYDRGGAMHTGNGNITILYKPGSQPGAGTIVEGMTLDFATYLDGPDRVDLNAEANTLTYAYRIEENIVGAEGYPSYPAGIHTFTVDLPTGETTQSYAPFSLEGSAEVLAKGRSYTLERRLDGENCAAILRWKELTWEDSTRDYELWLVRGDGSIQKLLLPSTALRYNGYYKPTDRAPDSLEISADGRTLTYTYRFDEALADGDTVCHEAGTYTYTVDLATGELSVAHTADG